MTTLFKTMPIAALTPEGYGDGFLRFWVQPDNGNRLRIALDTEATILDDYKKKTYISSKTYWDQRMAELGVSWDNEYSQLSDYDDRQKNLQSLLQEFEEWLIEAYVTGSNGWDFFYEGNADNIGAMSNCPVFVWLGSDGYLYWPYEDRSDDDGVNNNSPFVIFTGRHVIWFDNMYAMYDWRETVLRHGATAFEFFAEFEDDYEDVSHVN